MGSPARRLPQGSSNNLLLRSTLCSQSSKHFTEEAAIFTSSSEGKRVLKAHSPQNHPAGEGRAASPCFPNLPAVAAKQDAASLPLGDSALELSWAGEGGGQGGRSFFPPPSASREVRQCFLSAKGL